MSLRAEMSYEFKLPDLGEGLTEGEIAHRLVEVGQEIAEDDRLSRSRPTRRRSRSRHPPRASSRRFSCRKARSSPSGRCSS
jgi:hypothetical protein